MKEWVENNREHVRAYDRKRYAENKETKLERASKYYCLNKDKIKEKTSKYQKYISKPRKLAQLEEIAGRCKPATCELCGNGGRIYFDHDHSTGKFRGWLCMQCNLALGHARDSTELLYKLIDYLENSRGSPTKLVRSPIQIKINT